MGADVDWKLVYGKTRKGPISVFDNFKQYKLPPPDILCMDLSQSAWRHSYEANAAEANRTAAAASAAEADDAASRQRRQLAGFVDAIVCDPPYGVRAGARKLGRADKKDKRSDSVAAAEANAAGDGAEAAAASTPAEAVPAASASTTDATHASTTAAVAAASPHPSASTSSISAAASPAHHVPSTVVYDVEDVIHDLLDLSAQLLRVGGRLVYWLPTTTGFRNDELPAHPCLRQVSVGEQLVRSHFSRRLITMEKVLPFTPERRMRRRNKDTEPPPKYANLKEAILALAEEGPDKTGIEFQQQQQQQQQQPVSLCDEATATELLGSADATSAVAGGVDLAVSFAPRPLSIRSQKRLAKAESIRQQRAALVAAHGALPSKRERAAARGPRVDGTAWEQMQREKNKEVQIERARKQREIYEANKAAAAAAAAAATAGAVGESEGASADPVSQSTGPAATAASTPSADASMTDVPAASASSATAASASCPPSPDAPPSKKARVGDS